MKELAVSARLNSMKARPELFSWKYGIGDPRDLLRRAETVTELSHVSLNYPEHFPKEISSEVKNTIQESKRLKMSTLNLRYDNVFSAGAFCHPEKNIRQKAITITKAAVELCVELGGTDVVIWLGSDGFDYPFQKHYLDAWDWGVDGIFQVADYAEQFADLRVSIEYKPSGPRRFSILGNFGMTLQAVSEINKKNTGITCDYCHMLIAREFPPLVVALCMAKKKLFGVHFNDGYSWEDDGLMVGSVNPYQTLETVYQLKKYDFDGFLYFDTFPINEDPVRECEANIRRLTHLFSMSQALLNNQDFQSALENQDAVMTNEYLWDMTFPDKTNKES